MSTVSQRLVVAAYFARKSDAENAVRELEVAGFGADQIKSSQKELKSQDKRRLTSDEYSPNSATASAAAHPESFGGKVKDFFAGETADSDINDNPVTDRAHADISSRAYEGNRRAGRWLVTITLRAPDQKTEAEQILTRNNGEIRREVPAGGESEYVRIPGR